MGALDSLKNRAIVVDRLQAEVSLATEESE
jgi:hypothetical protein